MKIIVLFILGFYFFGCTADHKKIREINKWEFQNNGFLPDEIVINEWKSYRYADSAIVLECELVNFKSDKKNQLNEQLDKVSSRLSEVDQQLIEEKNPAMIMAITTKRKEISKEKERIMQIIDIYNNHPELTQIQWYENQLARYKADSLKLIGYVAVAELRQEQTKQVKWYLFSCDMKHVVAVVQ